MEASNKSISRSSATPSGYWLRATLGFPLAVVGGLTSTLFALLILGYVADRLGGGRPQPSLLEFFNLWFVFGALPLVLAILLLRRARPGHPSKRVLSWLVSVVVFVLITVGADLRYGPRNWHSALRSEWGLTAEATTLKATHITPHLDTDIVAGTNVLWCGTMQLAWNEACDLIGGDLHFDQEHPMVVALNQHSFTKESIDDASYIAMAGFMKSNIHQSIRAAVQGKFGDTFKPGFIPDKNLTPRPQDFIAYACLFKSLAFPAAFERLDDSLSFGGVPVYAFGLDSFKPAYTNLYPQVLILDYQSENDFVIELKTQTEGDRLILAKLEPLDNFAGTVARVQERASRTNAKPASTDDTLLVPRIDFDLTRSFSEIEGRHLVSTNLNVANDLLLLSVVQSTRFAMNEKGVELRSEAHMAFGCAKQKNPTPKHRLVFDQPFMILLERANATMPYFALWVDNAELLVRR